MAKKPRRASSAAVKAAADRAAARAAGKASPAKPAVDIDPPIVKAAKIVEEVKKRKVGGPTKYKPEMVEQVKKLCALGLIDEEIAQFFGVTVRCLYKWKGRHPEFGAAIKIAGAPADDRVERSLYKRATGYTQDAVKIFLPRGAKEATIVPYKEVIGPDTTACIFWLKNRRPDLWRDVNRFEHTGKDGAPIETADDTGMDRARRLAVLLAKAAETDGLAH